MSRSLAIVPVVEGHGDVSSVPILLRRIGTELYSGALVTVGRPIRIPRGLLVRTDGGKLTEALNLAKLKLDQMNGHFHQRAALVLFDADDDLACQLAPLILERSRILRSDLEIRVALPSPEFETWFVASADDPKMEKHLQIEGNDTSYLNAEPSRLRKGWIEKRFKGTYSETVDQPKLTAAMNLELTRRRSRSFDKLCRDIGSLLQ